MHDDNHRVAITFMHEYYAEHGITPDIRHVVKYLATRVDTDKSSQGCGYSSYFLMDMSNKPARSQACNVHVLGVRAESGFSGSEECYRRKLKNLSNVGANETILSSC